VYQPAHAKPRHHRAAKIAAAGAAALALTLGTAAPALANPGPGSSTSCAPGQQGNPDPAFKPGSCDNK
jgi:hypothetical protein